MKKIILTFTTALLINACSETSNIAGATIQKKNSETASTDLLPLTDPEDYYISNGLSTNNQNSDLDVFSKNIKQSQTLISGANSAVNAVISGLNN